MQRGIERSANDVDAGILFNQNADGFTGIDMENKISKLLDLNIDLIDMQKSGSFLRYQIYKYEKTVCKNKTDLTFLQGRFFS